MSWNIPDSRKQFLSTPSARRATGQRGHRRGERRDFYPRPPRGGRPAGRLCGVPAVEFLSTPSARRATLGGGVTDILRHISIHALREEGDLVNIGLRLCEGQFLSTPSARRATRVTRYSLSPR